MINFDVITEGELLTIIRRTRPVKLAFFIPQKENKAIDFIKCNSIIWGGSRNIAIPYPSRQHFREDWKKVLDFLRPDEFINWVETSPEFWKTIKTAYQIQPSELKGWVDCVTMQSIVVAGRKLNQSFNIYPLFECSGELDKKYFFPVIAATGLLGDSILPSSDPFKNTSYVDALLQGELSEAKIDLESMDSYLEIVKKVYDRECNASSNTPLTFFKGLTNYRLSYEWHYSFEKPSLLGDRILFSRHNTNFLILVVGDTRSVPDLCLYWNLLTLYQNYSIPVFWIGPDDLFKEKYVQVIMDYANHPNKIYVTSASLDKGAIDLTLLKKIGEEIAVAFHKFGDFFSPDFSMYSSEDIAISTVRNRAINVLYPSDQLIENIPISYQYSLEFDVKLNSVNNYQLPHPALLRRNLHPEGFVKATRTKKAPESNLFSVRFPESWTIIETLLNSKKFPAQPSSHGLKVMGILNFFDKPEELAFLSMETFKDLIEEFNKHKYLLKGRLCKILKGGSKGKNLYNIDSNFINKLIVWLVKRKILARHFKVQCPLCRTNQFIPIGDIAEIIRCEGCFEEIILPLEKSKGIWYVMNQKFLQETREQGALLPLLTLGYLTKYKERSALAFYPGVEINLKNSPLRRTFNKESTDIDVIHISPEVNLTIGECKWSLMRLKDEEIDLYFTLAKEFDAELLFSTMSDLSTVEDRVNKIKQRGKKEGVTVRIIGSGNLLNFSYHCGGLGQEWLKAFSVEEKSDQHIKLIRRLISCE